MTAYPMFNNLLVALPLTGRPIPVDVMLAFHAMAYPMNYNHMVVQLRGMKIAEARNQFASIAELHNQKYIFMWDEDVACPPQTIPELIYKMEHHPEAAIIGGVYCLKREPPEPLVFKGGNGGGPCWDWKAGEFFEVSGLGMGCTLIRTEVFKDLKKPWFSTNLNYERVLDGNGGIESWSEDLWFCDRVVKTGRWKIYCDSSIICDHYDMTTSHPYSLPQDSKPRQHLRAGGAVKILDLGSGTNPYNPGDGNVPVRAEDARDEITGYRPDYRCDLRKLPFAGAEFDVVFSAALDRFLPSETEEVLREWLRVTKTELRLVVNDVKWIAREILEERLKPEALNNSRRLSCHTFESLQGIFGVIGEELKVEKVECDPAHIAVRVKKS